MASIILPVRVTLRLQGLADKHAGVFCRPAFICQHKQSNRDDTFFWYQCCLHTDGWTVKSRNLSDLCVCFARTASCLFGLVAMAHPRRLLLCVFEVERFTVYVFVLIFWRYNTISFRIVPAVLVLEGQRNGIWSFIPEKHIWIVISFHDKFISISCSLWYTAVWSWGYQRVYFAFLLKCLQLLRGYRTLLFDCLKEQQLVSHKSSDWVLIKINAPAAPSVTVTVSSILLVCPLYGHV